VIAIIICEFSSKQVSGQFSVEINRQIAQKTESRKVDGLNRLFQRHRQDLTFGVRE
jgi:hypothetical protein